jgi:hypothetical protein
MDRQIEATKSSAKPDPSSANGHMMCRTALWGIAGCIACGYFAWISFSHIMRAEYDWPHDPWTVATYVVWILLLGGVALDTRCLRERLFFGVLGVNFVVGCALTLWKTVPAADVRTARIGTGVLWALAAVLSLATLRNSNAKGETPGADL